MESAAVSKYSGSGIKKFRFVYVPKLGFWVPDQYDRNGENPEISVWFKTKLNRSVIPIWFHKNGHYFSEIGDKLIEVVGLENCLHMGQVRTGLRSSGKRLAQCSHVIVKVKKRFPMQVDGEPWEQPPGMVRQPLI